MYDTTKDRIVQSDSQDQVSSRVASLTNHLKDTNNFQAQMKQGTSLGPTNTTPQSFLAVLGLALVLVNERGSK